jgi:hypothetical protein
VEERAAEPAGAPAAEPEAVPVVVPAEEAGWGVEAQVAAVVRAVAALAEVEVEAGSRPP